MNDDWSAPVLTGGTWQPARGVMRWVLNQPPPPPPPPTPIGQLIACPTCHAHVDETCRTKSGHTTTPHGSRLAPRLCPCGARLGYKRRLCNPCSRLATRLSKRDHHRRRRAAQRAAA